MSIFKIAQQKPTTPNAQSVAPPQCDHCGYHGDADFMEAIDINGVFDSGDGEPRRLWACLHCMHGEPYP